MALTKDEESHLQLRRYFSQILSDIGIQSDPGWLDINFINAIRQELELQPINITWDSDAESAFLMFKTQALFAMLESGAGTSNDVNDIWAIAYQIGVALGIPDVYASLALVDDSLRPKSSKKQRESRRAFTRLVSDIQNGNFG